jgi:hypothetical protein
VVAICSMREANAKTVTSSPENLMKVTKASETAQLEAKLAEAQATIARQTQELMDVRAELEQVRGPADVRLNWEIRAISRQPELTDIRKAQPTPGSRVFALGRGGVLVPTVWGKNENGFYGAWMSYPEMPKSVKEWLSGAWHK